jgi:hypothetical protein
MVSQAEPSEELHEAWHKNVPRISRGYITDAYTTAADSNRPIRFSPKYVIKSKADETGTAHAVTGKAFFGSG